MCRPIPTPLAFCAALALAAVPVESVRQAVSFSSNIDDWMSQLCKLQSSNNEVSWFSSNNEASECEAYVAIEELHCETVKASKFEYVKHHDGRCNTFKELKKLIAADQIEEIPQMIKDAAKICTPAVKEVCASWTCPTYNKINNIELNCTKVCEKVGSTMWGTGQMTNCTKDKSHNDCMKEINDELIRTHRIKELEALTREHALKCMCVHRSVDNLYCFNDDADDASMGIPMGKSWCDFDATPSWQGMIKEKEWSRPDNYPEPVCSNSA